MKYPIFCYLWLLVGAAHASLIPLGEHADGRFTFANGAWSFELYSESDEQPYSANQIFLPLSDKPYVGNTPSISGARLTRSASANFDFIGVAAGQPLWVAVQGTPGLGEAWPGFDNQQSTSVFGSYIPNDARVSQSSAQPWIRVSLVSYTPPHGKTSHFSMWSGGASPTVWMSTFLSTSSDDFYFTAGSHTHMNWGFTAQGVHQVTVRASAFRGPGATNPTPVSAPQTLFFSVGTIGRWQATRFTASELQNPAISSLTADPDRDSLTNLTEYAFGLDPKSGNLSPVASGLGLPKYSITSFNGTPHHTLIYPRRKATNRLQADNYTPEFSPSLDGTWSNAGFTVSVATFPAPQSSLNADWELVTARKPILLGESRGFCRVVVRAGDGF